MYRYQRIRDCREDKDLYQKNIADVLETSQRQYSRWETGTQEIPLHIAKKLAKFYNVTLDYLTEIQEETR